MVIFHRLWKQLLVFNSYETMVIWIYGGNTSGKRTIMDYLQYQKVVLIPPKSRRQDLLSRGNLRSKCQAADGDWGRPLDTAVSEHGDLKIIHKYGDGSKPILTIFWGMNIH